MLTQEQQQKQLGILLKKPQNLLCADCSSKSPCWASLDFGVFVCMNCSGAHRSLGQSVTRIKSTKLDTWNKDWIWHMQLNNKIINQYYQAQYNSIMNRKPNPNSSLNEIKKFVYDKYVRKLFAIQGQDDPITNLKNGKPPLKINESSTQSQGGNKIQITQHQQQQQFLKVPTKSVVTQQIQVQQIKKNKNLLDDASSGTNRTPSENNQKIRQQINLFEVDEEQRKKTSSPNPHQNVYNKQHYNSFSGKGARNSSAGPVSFQTLFSHPTTSINTLQNNKNINFDQFKTLTQQTTSQHTTYTTPSLYPSQQLSYNSPNNHHAHIHHHNYPHMHVHTTGMGTGYGHQPINNYNHVYSQPPPPTHVTMNINMNMYSNVTNINLHDNANPNGTISLNNQTNKNNNNNNTNLNLNDHIKLDINDFTVKNKNQITIVKKQSNKSWVDDWK